MFSFRRQTAQAKKKIPATTPGFQFRWKSAYNWIFPALLLLSCIAYLNQLDTLLPIKKVKLSGSFEHIEQQEVESALQSYVGEGFFSLDIHALQKKLGEKPWADSVSIRRVWPDRLDIMIVERKPVARWDEKHLLSDRAVVFAADVDSFQQLPLIHARSEKLGPLLSRYYSMEKRFQALGETLVSLRQDNRGALDIELSDGMLIKVGRAQIEHKISRLMTIYEQQILPRRSEIRQLDLRYSNGFAVAWKKEYLEASDEASIWSNSNV
ncbi:MAG: FtsQ-type POTRA domain-containing protein [Gammaproteobacteria bacterium]|nr:FtsQ-type POTRA domain-containing protein [Gammaproteobacteria bacterium]